jgi:SAM-dependent methyltransferase
VRLRDVLALPAAYRGFGLLVGVARVRAIFVADYVRPRRGQRLLDIGCGPGSLVPYLTDVDYVGFDASASYIAAARARHPGARFFCERIGDHVASGERFDLVVAAGVLHHLNDIEALELLRLADARLCPGGRFLALDPCLTAGQHPVARWLVSRDRGRHMRSKDEHLRLVRQVFPDASATLRHDLLRVPYTHLIVECRRG